MVQRLSLVMLPWMIPCFGLQPRLEAMPLRMAPHLGAITRAPLLAKPGASSLLKSSPQLSRALHTVRQAPILMSDEKTDVASLEVALLVALLLAAWLLVLAEIVAEAIAKSIVAVLGLAWVLDQTKKVANRDSKKVLSMPASAANTLDRKLEAGIRKSGTKLTDLAKAYAVQKSWSGATARENESDAPKRNTTKIEPPQGPVHKSRRLLQVRRIHPSKQRVSVTLERAIAALAAQGNLLIARIFSLLLRASNALVCAAVTTFGLTSSQISGLLGEFWTTGRRTSSAVAAALNTAWASLIAGVRGLSLVLSGTAANVETSLLTTGGHTGAAFTRVLNATSVSLAAGVRGASLALAAASTNALAGLLALVRLLSTTGSSTSTAVAAALNATSMSLASGVRDVELACVAAVADIVVGLLALLKLLTAAGRRTGAAAGTAMNTASVSLAAGVRSVSLALAAAAASVLAGSLALAQLLTAAGSRTGAAVATTMNTTSVSLAAGVRGASLALAAASTNVLAGLLALVRLLSTTGSSTRTAVAAALNATSMSLASGVRGVTLACVAAVADVVVGLLALLKLLTAAGRRTGAAVGTAMNTTSVSLAAGVRSVSLALAAAAASVLAGSLALAQLLTAAGSRTGSAVTDAVNSTSVSLAAGVRGAAQAIGTIATDTKAAGEGSRVALAAPFKATAHTTQRKLGEMARTTSAIAAMSHGVSLRGVMRTSAAIVNTTSYVLESGLIGLHEILSATAALLSVWLMALLRKVSVAVVNTRATLAVVCNATSLWTTASASRIMRKLSFAVEISKRWLISFQEALSFAFFSTIDTFQAFGNAIMGFVYKKLKASEQVSEKLSELCVSCRTQVRAKLAAAAMMGKNALGRVSKAAARSSALGVQHVVVKPSSRSLEGAAVPALKTNAIAHGSLSLAVGNTWAELKRFVFARRKLLVSLIAIVGLFFAARDRHLLQLMLTTSASALQLTLVECVSMFQLVSATSAHISLNLMGSASMQTVEVVRMLSNAVLSAIQAISWAVLALRDCAMSMSVSTGHAAAEVSMNVGSNLATVGSQALDRFVSSAVQASVFAVQIATGAAAFVQQIWILAMAMASSASHSAMSSAVTALRHIVTPVVKLAMQLAVCLRGWAGSSAHLLVACTSAILWRMLESIPSAIRVRIHTVPIFF